LPGLIHQVSRKLVCGFGPPEKLQAELKELLPGILRELEFLPKMMHRRLRGGCLGPEQRRLRKSRYGQDNVECEQPPTKQQTTGHSCRE
jgi:hypothetical protein